MRLRDDRGAGSILALTVVTAALLIGAIVLTASGAAIAYARVGSVADAAALAAADAALGFVAGEPCERAALVAAAHEAAVSRCELHGADVVVSIAHAAPLAWITASARAGAPAP